MTALADLFDENFYVVRIELLADRLDPDGDDRDDNAEWPIVTGAEIKAAAADLLADIKSDDAGGEGVYSVMFDADDANYWGDDWIGDDIEIYTGNIAP